MINIPQDYHIHSNFSEDAIGSLEDLCLAAITKGIPEIGFSEHWDVGPFEKNPFYFKPAQWFLEINRLQMRYSGQVAIRAGLEVAEPHLYGVQFQELLKRFQFDYIIGSVHWAGPNFMFDELFFKKNYADDIYQSYFQELEKMVSTSDIDIVAHFDIPARTAKAIIGYNPARYETQIKRVLKLIIERGLALELNSAGFRKSLNNLMPDPLILSWYYDMGGRRLTLGSDSHQVNQLGMYLDKVVGILTDMQFSFLTRFENRQYYPIPINKQYGDGL